MKKDTPIQPTECGVCHSPDVGVFWAMRGYELAYCRECGLVWDYIPVTNIGDLYAKEYYINNNPKGGYANYYDGMHVNRKTFSSRLTRVKKIYGNKGKLLDVGCAFGDSLEEAEKLGWKDPEGVELSDYAVNLARKKGLKVKKGTLKAASYKNNSFDIILYQDVIEHVEDPIKELKNAYKVLKKGGVLFIVTPDIGGYWARILGPWWYHYKPKEHLFYFSRTSLTKALELVGFSKIKTAKTYHILSVGYILNRLRYYFPNIFGLLLQVSGKVHVNQLSIKSYTGELEAWAQK